MGYQVAILTLFSKTRSPILLVVGGNHRDFRAKFLVAGLEMSVTHLITVHVKHIIVSGVLMEVRGPSIISYLFISLYPCTGWSGTWSSYIDI